jgi:hypothetical protein
MDKQRTAEDEQRKRLPIPLQDAPQMAQVKMTFFFPALLSSRLPQSLQKMSEPMADIFAS